MNISGIHSLIYGCEDLETAKRFFSDVGMESEDGETFGLADGTSVVLRRVDDNALPSAPVGGDTAREIIWRVDSDETLQEIGEELSTDRNVSQSPDGVLHVADDLGYALGFTVATTNQIELAAPVTNTIGSRKRFNTRADGTEVKVPKLLRTAHIGCWAPGDVDENKAFYVDRLGFRETDYVKDIGVFLRAPGSSEHHDVFLSKRGDRAGFQHVAYEVRDFDEVMFLGSHLEEQGWETHFGPGRHIFGSNIFWYFWNPAGGLLEITADLDCIDDDWEMRYHDSLPKGAGTWLARPVDQKRIPFRTREQDQIIE
ncbi:MAG: bleomycin resistance protein [Rhodospirillaceae bacterium]|nr:bleomycin resistance protein [Rhodospirillaceae bacterium]|tara:strand:+ start:1261 stop:2199 length:939 start_codon:yes stop_codon:yes gene_type:complete